MNPFFSVIICTCDRPQLLQKTLDSLLNQTLDNDCSLEVVVVDNTPEGLMKSTVESFHDRFEGRLQYSIEPAKGKSNALNHGIRKAKGNILAFTDDDVIVDPQWLSILARFFKDHRCDGVGGRVLPIYPAATSEWVQKNAVKLAGGVVIYDYGEGEFLLQSRMDPFIGSNFAFRREIFDACGLFRTDIGPGTNAMGEDTEFVERLAEQGKILYYCGKAVIWHPVDLKRISLRHMARWHIALGRFAARREVEKKEQIVYLFGIPRYLWKGIIIDFCSLCFVFINRNKFLDAWRAFFRKIGMFTEYTKKPRQIK